MLSEEMALTEDEMAEVVGAHGACTVIAVACAGTIGVPDFEFAIVALIV